MKTILELKRIEIENRRLENFKHNRKASKAG